MIKGISAFCAASTSVLVASVWVGCAGDSEADDPKPDTGVASETGAPIDTGVDTGAADSKDGGEVKPGCLKDTTEFDKVATLPTGAKKCVTGQFSLPVAATQLSWGRHGGPLGFESSPALALVRWRLPAGRVGALTATRQTLTVPDLPSGLFWSGGALDLPFFDWTAFAYTGAGGAGELILATSGGKLTRYFMNGLYGNASLGVSAGEGGRLLYTGLSTLSLTAVSGARDPGLWAADSCGTTSAPRLLAASDAACKDPTKLGTWQNGDSGLVTRDPGGNVFAMLSTVDFTDSTKSFYEAHGFVASTVARGQPATKGDTIMTLNGTFVSSMAADGKALYFQPNDGKTYEAEDVKAIAYAVDGAAKKVAPSGSPTTFLAFKKPGTAVDLFVDDGGSLWVGVVTSPSSDAGAGTATYFVVGDS